MAAHGLRDLGEGREAVANAADAAALRSQGRRMSLLTAASAVSAALVLLLASR